VGGWTGGGARGKAVVKNFRRGLASESEASMAIPQFAVLVKQLLFQLNWLTENNNFFFRVNTNFRYGGFSRTDGNRKHRRFLGLRDSAATTFVI